MGAIQQPIFGEIRFVVPDFSVPASERSLFGFPGNTKSSDERVELQDFRTSRDVVKGPEGLDVQGFAYVQHRSALSDSDGWSGDQVEEMYLAEVEDLICNITGAKRAVANNVAFRRKIVIDQVEDPKFYYKKDCALDMQLQKLDKSRAMIMGKTQDDSMEPTRIAHIDYSVQGLRNSARYCRKDIKAAAQNALDAEDANPNGAEVPRYAAYSVWRPLKTVKRDPLAVCDWRTVGKDELSEVNYRAPSDLTDSEDYLMHAWAALPRPKSTKQKWYFMPNQREDEVLIVKFADTAADVDPAIAGGCPHASPNVDGTQDAEPRNSVECRVLAFW